MFYPIRIGGEQLRFGVDDVREFLEQYGPVTIKEPPNPSIHHHWMVLGDSSLNGKYLSVWAPSFEVRDWIISVNIPGDDKRSVRDYRYFSDLLEAIEFYLKGGK